MCHLFYLTLSTFLLKLSTLRNVLTLTLLFYLIMCRLPEQNPILPSQDRVGVVCSFENNFCDLLIYYR